MKTKFQNKDAAVQRYKRKNLFIFSALVLCLVFAACGCKPKMREGEVFILLKSDEVKPLADVGVIGLDQNFGERFTDWQRRWNTELSQPKLLVQKNTTWRGKLESLDRQIKETSSQTNTLDAQAKNNLTNRLQELLAGQKILTNRIAEMQTNLDKVKVLYDQLAAIKKPYQEKLESLEARKESLEGQTEILKETTLAKINDVIVAEKLPLKKLESAEDIFETDIKIFASSTSDRDIGQEDYFFVACETNNAGYTLTLLKNVSQKLGTSSECNRVLQTAFSDWKRFKTELELLNGFDNEEGSIENANKQLKQALIPFENQFGTGIPEEYDERSASLRGAQEDLQDARQKLNRLQAGSLDDEIEHLRRTILLTVSDLISARDEQERQAENEVLRQKQEECITSFAELMKSNAVYTTRTGSRGDFQMSARVAFVFAGTIRSTTGEVPYWLVKVDPQQKTIRLSNSNLAAEDNSDELWMLKYTP